MLDKKIEAKIPDDTFTELWFNMPEGTYKLHYLVAEWSNGSILGDAYFTKVALRTISAVAIGSSVSPGTIMFDMKKCKFATEGLHVWESRHVHQLLGQVVEIDKSSQKLYLHIHYDSGSAVDCAFLLFYEKIN